MLLASINILFSSFLSLQRSGCLGSALAVMKKSSKFLPVCESIRFTDVLARY